MQAAAAAGGRPGCSARELLLPEPPLSSERFGHLQGPVPDDRVSDRVACVEDHRGGAAGSRHGRAHPGRAAHRDGGGLHRADRDGCQDDGDQGRRRGWPDGGGGRPTRGRLLPGRLQRERRVHRRSGGLRRFLVVAPWGSGGAARDRAVRGRCDRRSRGQDPDAFQLAAVRRAGLRRLPGRVAGPSPGPGPGCGAVGRGPGFPGRSAAVCGRAPEVREQDEPGLCVLAASRAPPSR